MICRTAEEIARAAQTEPCEHGYVELPACPTCRLTEAEINVVATLLGPGLRARAKTDAERAVA